MKYDPHKHHRHSIRLKGYDYSQLGWYFVTVVTQNREMLFGEIANHKMAYQTMPNHFHGIIHIVRQKLSGAMHSDPNIRENNENDGRNASPRPHGTIPGSLGAIMQNFLSVTTRKINRIRKTPGARLWQRNYWEHIIRNEQELNRIRHYVINNPKNWKGI